MTVVTTAYRPSTHGFRFGNGFEHQVVPGWRTYGRCNGMAQVSCDYFYAGRRPPEVEIVDHGITPLSGLGAVTWRLGRADIVTKGIDDQVYTRVFRDGAWREWVRATGNKVAGTPALASWGAPRLDMVFRGAGDEIRHQWWVDERGAGPGLCASPNGTAFEIGAHSQEAPALAAPFADRLEAYVKGLDGNLWFLWTEGNEANEGNRWRGRTNLGRPPGVDLVGSPATASAYGWMNAVARGSDGAMWHREWRDNTWQPWRSAGGRLTSPPAVASPFAGRLEAYGRGTDGNVWVNIFQNRAWEGWASLGAPPPGITEDQPAAISLRGLLGVFVRGHDGAVWHKRWFRGGWSSWETTEPAVPPLANQLTDAIFGRMMTSTHNRVVPAIALGPLALAAIGAPANFVTWMLLPDAACFELTVGPELDELVRRLSTTGPVPLGLVGGSGWGHEVVAWEVLRGHASLYSGAPDPRPGPHTFVRIYDPEFPGCDDQWLRYDANERTVVQSSGAMWRGAFVRSDYSPQRPPV